MSTSFAQDTTFAIEKIVQNAYIDPVNQGLPPTYLNSVLGESMSSLVAVNETSNGVTYRKLYMAYVTDISFTSIDTVSGNIAIARFNENLQLESIFRSPTLNTTNGRETNPSLIYSDKRLFLAYSTKSSITATSATYDINKEGTSFDLVLAGLDIFTFNTNLQSEPITGVRDNIDILWIKQNMTFNSSTADDGFSNLADASNQNIAPFLAYDALTKVLYCAYNQCISASDYDVEVLAVIGALGRQTGPSPFTRSYDNTAVITQLINLPQSSGGAGTLNASMTINTARKDLFPSIAVDTSSNLHLVYRTEGTGVTIGSSTKNITINGNTYIYVRMSPPNFQSAIGENIIGIRNSWTITDISTIPLTTVSGNYYSPIDIKYSKGFLYVAGSSYNTGSSTSFPVVAKINAHSSPFIIENVPGAAIQSATGAIGPTAVKVITDIKDPSNNDNVILAYHTYPTNGTTHINLTRYNLSGTAFVFRDFTTSADMSGFDVSGKTTRNPSMVYLNGYLYIGAETNAATSYTDLEGVSYINKYAGTQTITGFFDIAIAKLNIFKPNSIRDLSLTEGINVIDLTWGPDINATAGGPVNWWPPTNGSTFGYRISFRKTGEDGASFIDISDVPYNPTLNSFRIASTTYGSDASVGTNQRVLEKGYQYEFIVRALLNGSPGDYFTLSGMPVDGYVIASLSGTTSILLGSNGGRQTLTSSQITAGQIPTNDCSFNTVNNNEINLTLSGGVAYNIAVRSYVLLQSNFANYSITDQSGIVIPRYAAPDNVTATAGSNCIKVTFQTVPGDNIDGYEIQYSKNSFTTTLKTLFPIKSMTPNTTVTTFLAFNDKDNIDAELPDGSGYSIKIRAVGGRNLTSVNGIPLTADVDGYRIYGITSLATAVVAPIVISEPSITISGERNLFEINPSNPNVAGYIHSQTIWPRWLFVGNPNGATLSGCISINGFRFRFPVTTFDLSLSTTSLANTTLIPNGAILSPAGITRTTVNPATLYDIKIFLCNAIGDPSGRIISRKVLTAPAQPSLSTVLVSAFNPNATAVPPANLPTLTTSWAYNDLSGYPDLVGFKLYYKRPSETSFNIHTILSSRELRTAIINNVAGGSRFEFFIRAYVTPRRIGEYLIITDASGNNNQPGETSSPRFGSVLTTAPVNTIVRFLPSNQSATFIFDDSIHNKDHTSYTVTVAGQGYIYNKISNSLVIGGLTASTSYTYILTISGNNFTTVNFTTASRAAQDINLISVTASTQSIILNLGRTVRSASGENLVVSYRQETAIDNVLGSQVFRRFYATDSSQVIVTGLFPKRDISDIQLFIEEFYPETNLFFYSNITSHSGSVQPTFFAPRAPKLTSATPGLGDISYNTPYQARISWTPNVNYRA